jgi:uncharacterized protein
VIKFLIVAGAVLLLLWLLFGGRSRGTRRGAPPPSTPPRTESMRVCAHCGVHLPASEALLLGGQAYCSAAHRDAGPRV